MRLALVDIFTYVFLLKGAFAQEALLSRLPSCAVSLQALHMQSVISNTDLD
jgi:hypothetical protein